MNLIQLIAEYGNLLKTKGDTEAFELLTENHVSEELCDHIKGCFENSDNIKNDDADLRWFLNGEEIVNVSEIRIECNFGDDNSMTIVVSPEGIIRDSFSGESEEKQYTESRTFEEMFDADIPED